MTQTSGRTRYRDLIRKNRNGASRSRKMNYTWNWSVIYTEPYFGWLISGLRLTLLMACCAIVIAFVFGSLIGVLRTTDTAPLRIAAAVYVEFFRNIPLLVQLFLWFFVVPELLPGS